MKKYFLMLCVLATTAILIGGCEKEKEPKTDPKGTIIVFMRNATNAEQTYVQPQNCVAPFFIDEADNFNSHNNTWRFKVVGNVETKGENGSMKEKKKRGLEHYDFEKVSTATDGSETWPTQVAVLDGYGYWGVCDHVNGIDTDKITVKIYVKRWILNAATNGIIGAEVRYLVEKE